MNTISLIIQNAGNTLRSESESIAKSIDLLTEEFAQAVIKIFETKGRLIITGIGKSAHIATKIAATLNSTGTPSAFMHAAEAVHGDLGMVTPADIILCISNSGNSPEIKVLVPLLKRDGNILIAMTANKDSFLGKNADYVINSYIERESCPNNLAPTNSTTVQLALGDAIATSLMELRGFKAEDFAKFHPGGALGKKLLLKVENILDSNNKPQVGIETPIKDVIVEISGKRLGVTAVLENEKIVGIITDGDIRRMLQNQSDFMALKAKDIMSSTPKTIEKTALVSEALGILENYSITQLVVTDCGKYAGIIHLHDILKEGIV
ncbi:KpsF/GutQ family sugar-phosphate isomerase [Myroides ceti]|uniref:KpsF/GutQ family sugar-phosphate isomerase n=1 Tax=Paenimyroides ceti TaxID=395087 RepID=A0ABT8CQS7_9FLAO|nr:KpsF/GutQ family sugar-phosphate isomerase [Paenimyroides ceti]MDN3706351.1 KpsF/GutQ family sugar-phosphate isomerase [Paenimyroides ceti]